MNIHIFGGNTVTGKFFLKQSKLYHKERNIISYSRNSKFNKADLLYPYKFKLAMKKEGGILISFAPIWLIAPFLSTLANKDKSIFFGIKGIIVCSSTSIITKRFSRNSFDKELVGKLKYAENLLQEICTNLNIKYHIIRPTMIYGSIDNKEDQNISILTKVMNRFPFILIPSQTGLRQPIHASQLAELIHKLVSNMEKPKSEIRLDPIISVGGDNEITYRQMLESIQAIVKRKNRTRKCIIISIPNKIFYILALPVLFISPKIFDALRRISFDLSGFTPVNELSGKIKRDFPI